MSRPPPRLLLALVAAVRVFLNRRMAALAALGLASGLPYLVATDTIAAWLSDVGVNVKTIGLFNLVVLPYALKFLWAPLLDRFEPPGLGHRRGWMAVLCATMAIVLGLIAVTGPKDDLSPLTMLAILGTALVFLSASFDIVFGAYLVEVNEQREQGAGAAAFVIGYRVAFVVGGAGILLLAEHWDWRAALFATSGAMALLAVIASVVPLPPRVSSSTTLKEAIVLPVQNLVIDYRWSLIVLAIFVLVFRLPDYLANRMTSPLLLQHLQFTKTELAWVRQALGFLITIIGALAGNAIMLRLSTMRWLLLFGVLQAASNAGFVLLASTEKSLPLLIGVIAFENFCNGLVSAGFVAFLMRCCDRRFSAMQYALFTGAMAAAGALGGAVSGYLVGDEARYARFFSMSALAGLPGLLLIPFLPKRALCDETAPASSEAPDSNRAT